MGLAKTVIQPSRGWIAINFKELWEFRELIYFLVWRDIKVKYKHSLLGLSWVLVQSAGTMLVFSVFFGHFTKIPSDGMPYPVFSYAAILPWNYFSQSLAQASSGLVQNSHLIRKIYFPRLVIPISSVLSNILDLLIASLMLPALLVYYGVPPSAQILLLPVFILLAILTALGAGLWVSALDAQYRDVRHLIPFLIQLWLFTTPVIYPSSILHGPWRTLYGLNPMCGVVDGFRWALLGARPPDGTLLASIGVCLGLLFSGAVYFRKAERSFADLL